MGRAKAMALYPLLIRTKVGPGTHKCSFTKLCLTALLAKKQMDGVQFDSRIMGVQFHEPTTYYRSYKPVPIESMKGTGLEAKSVASDNVWSTFNILKNFAS